MQYFLEINKHLKIVYIFFEKDAQMILEFLSICKKIILLFLFFRLCVAKTYFFSCNKTIQNKPNGCLPNTLLNLKRPYKK